MILFLRFNPFLKKNNKIYLSKHNLNLKNHQSIVSDGRDLSHYWLFTNVNLLRRSNFTLLKKIKSTD